MNLPKFMDNKGKLPFFYKAGFPASKYRSKVKSEGNVVILRA